MNQSYVLKNIPVNVFYKNENSFKKPVDLSVDGSFYIYVTFDENNGFKTVKSSFSHGDIILNGNKISDYSSIREIEDILSFVIYPYIDPIISEISGDLDIITDFDLSKSFPFQCFLSCNLTDYRYHYADEILA